MLKILECQHNWCWSFVKSFHSANISREFSEHLTYMARFHWWIALLFLQNSVQSSCLRHSTVGIDIARPRHPSFVAAPLAITLDLPLGSGDWVKPSRRHMLVCFQPSRTVYTLIIQLVMRWLWNRLLLKTMVVKIHSGVWMIKTLDSLWEMEHRKLPSRKLSVNEIQKTHLK